MVKNAQIDELVGLLSRAKRVLLTGPSGIDGDSIGACLALAAGLRHHMMLEVYVAGVAPSRYAWMDGAPAMLSDDELHSSYDAVVVLDGDKGRLTSGVERMFSRARYKVVIDHHGTTTADGYDLAIVDSSAAATCEMIYKFLKRWQVPFDEAIASSLYVGLIFDTGGFRHSNTTPVILRMAAELLETGIDVSTISYTVLSQNSESGVKLLTSMLANRRTYEPGLSIGGCTMEQMKEAGAKKADLEGLVDALLYIEGIGLACLFVELPNKRVKLSLRSRCGVDVAAFAKSMDACGGGHVKAAGVTMKGGFMDVVDHASGELLQRILEVG